MRASWINASLIFACAFRVSLYPSSSFSQEIDFNLKISGLTEIEIDPNQNRIIEEFFRGRVLNRIPPEVYKEWNPKTLYLEFTPSCPGAGYFMDPIKSRLKWKICLKPEFYKSADLFSILAHEFFHAIHYSQTPKEEPWLREGLAQWFEFNVTGKFPSLSVSSALQFRPPSFGSEYPNFFGLNVEKTKNNLLHAQYGRDFLFVFFVWSQFGKQDSVIWDLTVKSKDNEVGTEKAYQVLKTRPEFENFKKNPFDWPTNKNLIPRVFEVARLHNHIVFKNPLHKEDSSFLLFFIFSTSQTFKTQNLNSFANSKEFLAYLDKEPLLFSGSVFDGDSDRLIQYGEQLGSEEFDVLILDRNPPYSVVEISKFSRNTGLFKSPVLFVNRIKQL